MLRLAHRILDQFPRIRVFPGMEKSFRHLGKIIASHECVHIIADNVHDYIQARARDGGGHFMVDSAREYSNIAPPFERFFIEVEYEGHLCLQQGWLCHTLHRDSPHVENIPETLTTDWEWVIVMSMVVCLRDGACVYTGDVAFVAVAPQGSMISEYHETGVMGLYAKEFFKGNSELGEMSKTSEFTSIFGSALMTINFMNCRNVQLTDVTVSEGPPKKWLRRRRQPSLTYRTVTIDPEKPKRGHSKGNSEGIIAKTCPFHICRGHFVTYTDANGSKGMFGQGIYGTFWVPSHTRGDKKNGQTITTYNVKAPA